MNIYDYAEERKISIRRVLDFTLLTNPLGPSNKAKAAIRKALKSAALFPDPDVRYLKRYIARKEQIGPENIVFGHGSSQILEHLLMALRPVKLLVPTPLPRYYADILKKHTGQVVPFPLSHDEGFSVNVARLLSQIDGADVVVLPNPHIMTGTVIPPAHLSSIIAKVVESGKTLVIDEALTEFVGGPSFVHQAVNSGSTLILRTFSLFHALAGLRLGYAIGSQKNIEMLKDAIGTAPVSTLGAAGAIASLRDKGYYRRTESFLKEEKAYLSAKLGRVSSIGIIDTPCNFLLLKIETPAAELERQFLEREMLIEAFEDGTGRSFVRVPIRTHKQNARFGKLLERLSVPNQRPNPRI